MIRITSKLDGFRRAGIAHPAVPSEYQDNAFTAEQLAALEAEPMLVVEMVKEPKSPKEPKASKGAKCGIEQPSSEGDAAEVPGTDGNQDGGDAATMGATTDVDTAANGQG